MANAETRKPRELPPWLLIAGSAAVALHLLAVGALVLAAPSGPWPTPYGADMAVGPQFAEAVNMLSGPYYLRPLGMTHNYHFVSSRVAVPGVYFEVKLKDEQGNVTKTLRFPDEKANPWVYHRQTLLARALADDQPVQPRGAEQVAVTGDKVEKVSYWLMSQEVRDLVEKKLVPASLLGEEAPPAPAADPLSPNLVLNLNKPAETSRTQTLTLVTIPRDMEGVIPRTRQMARPSEWSLLMAKSFMRRLCREHGAHSAELVRHSSEAVMPAMMFLPSAPPDAFTEMVANFGDLNRDLGGEQQ